MESGRVSVPECHCLWISVGARLKYMPLGVYPFRYALIMCVWVLVCSSQVALGRPAVLKCVNHLSFRCTSVWLREAFCATEITEQQRRRSQQDDITQHNYSKHQAAFLLLFSLCVCSRVCLVQSVPISNCTPFVPV